MTHKDAPPETATQRACREWWTAREPHVKRAWSRTRVGSYHAESSQALHAAWEAAQLSSDDAERYRWIRNNPEHGFGGGALVQIDVGGKVSEYLWDTALDSAVDEAREVTSVRS